MCDARRVVPRPRASGRCASHEPYGARSAWPREPMCSPRQALSDPLIPSQVVEARGAPPSPAGVCAEQARFDGARAEHAQPPAGRVQLAAGHGRTGRGAGQTAARPPSAPRAVPAPASRAPHHREAWRCRRCCSRPMCSRCRHTFPIWMTPAVVRQRRASTLLRTRVRGPARCAAWSSGKDWHPTWARSPPCEDPRRAFACERMQATREIDPRLAEDSIQESDSAKEASGRRPGTRLRERCKDGEPSVVVAAPIVRQQTKSVNEWHDSYALLQLLTNDALQSIWR